MQMNLQQLEYIVAVDNHRHFSTAAESCFITQPTLSMMIQKLEDELSVKIFDRSKQPVVPTEIGKTLIEQARLILNETGRLRELVSIEKETVEGDLRIAIIPTLAPYLMPLFVKKMSERYPSVKLYISEMTTENIIQKLKQSTLDVGIMATPSNDKDLFENPLFFEEFVVYAAHDEKILSKRYLLANDIDINRLVLLQEGHCMRDQVINLCELKNATSMINNVFYEAGSIETLKNMIETLSGITILPELSISNMDEEQLQSVRFFKSPAPVREISLVTHRAFVKKRLIEILKVEIMDNLPEGLKKNKAVNRVGIG
jgi:LysR family transcriptional regulator, hydrogen peroxide-inducible genes activator